MYDRLVELRARFLEGNAKGNIRDPQASHDLLDLLKYRFDLCEEFHCLYVRKKDVNYLPSSSAEF